MSACRIARVGDIDLALTEIGDPDCAGDAPELIWAHGWGLSGDSLRPMAAALAGENHSLVLDLPGFGASPTPPGDWGTEHYADMAASWLATLPRKKRIWIGHSYGCRVGMQLAARHPEAIDGLVLMAAAGLKRKRTLAQAAGLKARIYAFKLAKRLLPQSAVDRLYKRVGSTDSQRAGVMRPIFIRAVNENLESVAKAVKVPTLLIYGRDDDDTPPEIGERLQRYIAGADLLVLNGFDHHTILTDGRHQVLNEIRRFQTGIR
jgi:pimeloyl-ACP methyl ester carboxylesterase